MKTPTELADEHWEWLEGLWESLPDGATFGITTTEYLYKTAFVHGYKHGVMTQTTDSEKTAVEN